MAEADSSRYFFLNESKVSNHIDRHTHREQRNNIVFMALFFWQYMGGVQNKNATWKQSTLSDWNTLWVTQAEVLNWSEWRTEQQKQKNDS